MRPHDAVRSVPSRTPGGLADMTKLPPAASSRGTGRCGPARPLVVLRSLVDGQVNPVADRVGGLVSQGLLEIPEHHADEEILLARPGPEAARRRLRQPFARGSGKHPNLLDARR